MAEVKNFMAPATLEGFSMRKDGSASLRFSTQELSAEDLVAFRKFYGSFGWLLFKESEWEAKDVPKNDPEFNGKTVSQRLRNTLYVLWQQKGANGYFEEFYNRKMEAIIEQVKTLLS